MPTSAITGDPACAGRLASTLAARDNQTVDLSFTLPDSGFVEFGWTSPSTYTPPSYVGAVPEPSMPIVGDRKPALMAF